MRHGRSCISSDLASDVQQSMALMRILFRLRPGSSGFERKTVSILRGLSSRGRTWLSTHAAIGALATASRSPSGARCSPRGSGKQNKFKQRVRHCSFTMNIQTSRVGACRMWYDMDREEKKKTVATPTQLFKWTCILTNLSQAEFNA